jgi:hypothetical protein
MQHFKQYTSLKSFSFINHSEVQNVYLKPVHVHRTAGKVTSQVYNFLKYYRKKYCNVPGQDFACDEMCVVITKARLPYSCYFL